MSGADGTTNGTPDNSEAILELADALQGVASRIAGFDADDNEPKQTIVEALSTAGRHIADSITPVRAVGTHDSEGSFVESLTEAVMGLTKAVARIADAIENVAAALAERNG